MCDHAMLPYLTTLVDTLILILHNSQRGIECKGCRQTFVSLVISVYILCCRFLADLTEIMLLDIIHQYVILHFCRLTHTVI